jgi:predicted alpha-1,2-mannosidase
MRQRAMVDNYRGLGYDRKFGYIPADLEEESVSKTLEYGYGDWAVAHVAKATGEQKDAELLLKRSQNYQHLFDPKTQFIRAKLENGEWALPFDPKGVGHSKRWRDYTESNAWQTTFGIQHDVKGLIEVFGGREAFIQKLDTLFDQSSEQSADAPPDIAGLVGQYAHGNEPSHHIAYLYVYAGAPYKTQQRVRTLLDTMYDNKPDGLAGNEDCGQMSAWYVMSALGLYAVDPVSGTYVFGSPLFERATVELGSGKKLVIRAKRSGPDLAKPPVGGGDLAKPRVGDGQRYVQSITVNGKPHDRLWIAHSEIAQGAEIVFTLGDQPNQQLGSSEQAAPPSLTA